MTTRGTGDPLEQWADELTGDVVTPLADAQVRSLAASAASAAAAAAAAGAAGTAAAASTAAGAAATGAGVSAAAKITASVALVATLGGIGAATGTLPDPVQRWVADLADGVGITLPSPDRVFDGLPGIDAEVPGLDLTDVTDDFDLPTVDDVSDSLPGSPDVTVPAVTVPDLEDTVDDVSETVDDLGEMLP